MNYYLDIETTGLEEKQNKIITIQYMELDKNAGNPVGPLKILKEWDDDEKTILKRFIEEFKPEDKWAFIPVGYGLGFEHRFFWERCKFNGLGEFSIFNGPFLDLMTVGVLMNKGESYGSGLDKMTNKPHDGKIIVQWYKEEKYTEIENYIKKEAEEFRNFYAKLLVEMPQLREKKFR